MNRRHILHTLALIIMSAGICLSGTTASAARSRLGLAKIAPLHVGQSMRYDGDLKITFLGVSKDSRCPTGALCIVAGDAEVILRIKAGNQPAKNYRLHTDAAPNYLIIPANVLPPGTVGIPKSYQIKIDSLSPRPRIGGKKILPCDYELGLGISVAL